MAVSLRWKNRPGRLPAARPGWFRDVATQLRASWVNRRWISAEELDEIRRGN